MHVDLAGLGVPRAKLDAERVSGFSPVLACLHLPCRTCTTACTCHLCLHPWYAKHCVVQTHPCRCRTHPAVQVKYLTAEELLEYELDVEMETGLLRYKRSGKLLHTGHNDGRTSLDLSDTRRPHTPPPPAVPLHTDSSDTPWWAQLPAAACTTGAAAPDPGGTQAWGVGGREGGMGQGSSFRRGVRRTMLDTLHEGQAHERQETGDVLEPGMLGAGQRGVGLDGAARSGVEGLMEEDAEVETEAEGQEVGSMVDGDSEGGSSLPRGGSSSDDVCGSGASPQSTGSTGRVADGGLLDVDGDGAANALDNGRKSCEGTYGLEKPALVRDSSVQAAISGYGGLFSPGAISGGGAGMGLAAAGQGATAEEEAPVVHQAEPAVDSAFCKAAAAALLTEGLRLQGPGEQRQQLEETGHVVQQEQQQQPHSPQPELAAPQPVTPPALQQLRQHSAPPLVVHQEKEKVAKWIYVVDPELRLYVHPKVKKFPMCVAIARGLECWRTYGAYEGEVETTGRRAESRCYARGSPVYTSCQPVRRMGDSDNAKCTPANDVSCPACCCVIDTMVQRDASSGVCPLPFALCADLYLTDVHICRCAGASTTRASCAAAQW